MSLRVPLLAVAMLAPVAASCGPGEDKDLGSGDDVLAVCDAARAKFAASVDPVFYEDPSFHYDSMLKPLAGIEDTVEYDTGVVQYTGSTDGITWVCLYSDKMPEAQWGWKD